MKKTSKRIGKAKEESVFSYYKTKFTQVLPKKHKQTTSTSDV